MFIYYDAGNNVLTLYNATIKKGLDYDEDITGGTSINDAAIGVFNQSGAAELTIKLYGSNTIAEVGKGIYVLAISQSTGSSSLTIMGNGSLDTSSSQTGIWVQSNSNNAALSIKNAKVTATIVDSYGSDGVRVQSEGNFSASLTVDGGSLTATGSGATFAGIQLLFGSGGSVSGTPTVTASNNAIVRANGGIANNSSSPIQYKTGSESTGGIVFDGNTGTVYGAVTLQEDLEIREGESLTIPDGASLTIGDDATLTNEGTVTTTGGGTLTNNGTINNSGTLPDNIECIVPPSITTTSLVDGTVGATYGATLGASGDPTSWEITGGTLPDGLTLAESTGVISGTPTVDGTFTFMIKATNSGGSDSKQLSITISPTAPSITTQPSNQSVTEGQTASFSVEATGSGTLTYQWQQSTGGSTWTDIDGANATTYTIENTTAAMSGYQYRCVVTDGNSTEVVAPNERHS